MRGFLWRVFGSYGPAALCIFLFDAVVIGSPIISVFTFLAAMVAGLVIVVLSLVRRKLPSKYAVAQVVLFPLFFYAGLGINRIDCSLARGRADIVIRALKDYQQKYKQYPESLDRLVPEFLPEIKKPKPITIFSNYRYWSHPTDGVYFSFVEIVPFGNRYYDFKKNAWGYSD